VNGNVTLSTDGTIYENRLVNGCIEILGDNITIRNVKVISTGDCSPLICNIPVQCGAGDGGSNTNLVVEDSEFDCRGNADQRGGRAAISGENYTARRIHVYGGCENSLWIEFGVVEDSFIDEPMDYIPAQDPHTDGIQIPSGSTNVTINHNRVYGNYVGPGDFGSSAIATAANPGQSHQGNLVITNNLLAGGGYTLYCPIANTGSTTITNNRFSRIFANTVGGFGPIYPTCGDIGTFTGNVYHETGLPL
jgi:hypothetical protein